MIDWSKELEIIFNDPLLADVVAPKKRATSSDRLIAGFQAICDFYEANGKLPAEETDSKLFHYLKGILASEAKIERCRPFDTFGILPQKDVVQEPEAEYAHNVQERELTEEEKLEQILNDPLLADIMGGEELGIFNVPEYMKERITARKEAEYVGSRKPCDDFEHYAEGFKEIHAGLKNGKYRLIKFEEPHVETGRYFIEQGVLVYIAGVEEIKKNKFGRRDGRIRCIYENGSESDILKLTLCKNIYTFGGYSIATNPEEDIIDTGIFEVNEKDVQTGTIYVLRSKSTRPEIAELKNLYKIGFTVTSMESRLANAKNEPTYLCADVEIVATWKVYNVKSSTFESLIHKLFDCVKLQVTVDGHRPQEWFIVPFNIIEQAIVNIIKGIPVMYDPKLQQIVLLQSQDGMNCISDKQPGASLICMGKKDVENRSWRPKKAPGRILIHADKGKLGIFNVADIDPNNLPETIE